MAIDRTWYNTLVDDDGSGTTGTIWNKSAVDALLDAIDLMEVQGRLGGTTQGITLASGNNNDQVLNAGVSILSFTVAVGGSTLTGVTGGVAGRTLLLISLANAETLTVASESGSSSAANRLTPGFVVSDGAAALYMYVNNRWRLIR